MAEVTDKQHISTGNPLAHTTLALVAHRIPVEMHQHFAVQVVMSLHRPFFAVIDQQPQRNIDGFVVDSNIAHACQPGDESVLIVSIDAASDMGKALRARLGGHSYVLLEDLLDSTTIQGFRNMYAAEVPTSHMHDAPLLLVAALSLTVPRVPTTDDRIVKAMDYINAHLNRPVRLGDVAESVALSEGRLRHLFVFETGIPITTYILWSRMKVALRGLARRQMSLAQAAYLAGYADHAHFTRTFKRMFGVNPSIFRELSQFLYVFDEPWHAGANVPGDRAKSPAIRSQQKK